MAGQTALSEICAGRRRRQRKGSLWVSEAPGRKIILRVHTLAHTSQCWSRQTPHGLRVCIWMYLVNGTGNSPSLGRPTSEQSNRTTSRGSVDTTKTRSDLERVEVCSGKRPKRAAKKTKTMASCQPPPPPPRCTPPPLPRTLSSMMV